jgi:glycosyltransferase involved in cell wall biosynthesis
MKNVLYIGQYKDSNGLGYSARRYIDCLISNNDINLSIRPIFLNKSSITNPLSLIDYSDYEKNSSLNYDCVIQHAYPDCFVYDKRFGKNIGVVEIETRNINRSGWNDKLNLMDEIWTNSINALECLYNCDTTSSIKVIPEPYDLTIYQKKHDPFFKFNKEETTPFIFYTIGQYTEQKNIKGIILAYLLEFNRQDNVRLFIKTDDYGQDPTELENIINYDIKQIKEAIRKNSFCDIDMVCGRLSDNDIIRLHQSGDCYINAVRSDCFGPCAIEALLSNKIIISTKNIGSSTYLNSSNSLMVDSIPTSVYSTRSFNKNIFTIYEEWDEPNILSIQKSMRDAYNMDNETKQTIISNYNHEFFNKEKIKETIL